MSPAWPTADHWIPAPLFWLAYESLAAVFAIQRGLQTTAARDAQDLSLEGLARQERALDVAFLPEDP